MKLTLKELQQSFEVATKILEALELIRRDQPGIMTSIHNIFNTVNPGHLFELKRVNAKIEVWNEAYAILERCELISFVDSFQESVIYRGPKSVTEKQPRNKAEKDAQNSAKQWGHV